MNAGKEILTFLVVAALTVAGCGRPQDDSHVHGEETAEVGVTFSAKNGLLVPADTAKFIGLEIADVEERKIPTELRFSAQVYHAASETTATLASGPVGLADAAGLREGQSISVQGSNEGVPLSGRIVTLKRNLATGGQVEVLLAITDAPAPLAVGAFVSVTVPHEGEKSVVSVPRSAVFRTTEGDFVYTVSGGHFMRTAVKLGAANPEFAEVTDGLYAGDQVVVQPAMTLWMAELQSLRGGKACADGH